MTLMIPARDGATAGLDRKRLSGGGARDPASEKEERKHPANGVGGSHDRKDNRTGGGAARDRREFFGPPAVSASILVPLFRNLRVPTGNILPAAIPADAAGWRTGRIDLVLGGHFDVLGGEPDAGAENPS